MNVCVRITQREAREKVKELSKRIGASNSQRLAASPPAKPQAKEPSARQRAVEYAKSSVPKPELLKQRSSLRKRGSSAPAATGGGEQVRSLRVVVLVAGRDRMLCCLACC